jgi:superfamily II DNA or RNA helicase
MLSGMDLIPAHSRTETAGSRVLVRGRRWTVAEVTRSADCAALRLNEIGYDRALTLLTPFDRPRPIDGEPRPRVVRPRRWLHEVDRALLQLHPFGTLHAAAHAPIRLLPYQLEPALAVLRHGVTRLLVADGVGLGKTIQAGLLLLELAHRHESCRALVIAPAGLREQWLAELSARFGLRALPADTAWLRSMSAERPAHVNPWSLPGIYVASHDLVKRPEVLRPLEDVTWDAVVIDEAHAVTSGTDRRAAVDAIAVRSRHVMLLTATPNGGDPAELDALCRIGGNDPIVLFQRSRADVADSRPRKTTVLTIVPSTAERRMHDLLDRYSRRVWEEAGRRGDERARLVSIVLRKRALSSAGSLGASVERRLALLSDRADPWQLTLPLASVADEDPLADDEPRLVISAPALSDPGLERRLLTAIAEAARLAAADERKTRFLLRLLSRIREPAIVFTEYRDTLARLERRVAGAGHVVAVLHGGMTPAERGRVQHTFNERGGILLATDAASEGLNLHHRCRVVIHYELPWNPSRLEQRVGRVDRLGQTRRVHELALVAAHTAERLVVAPLVTRLAVTGTTRGRMLDALTESRVAAAVMANVEPARVVLEEPAAKPDGAVAPPEDLAAQAVREAARLEHHRGLAARSSRGAEPDAGWRAVASALARRTSVPSGLYLVFALTLAGADGSRLHAEARLVRAELQPDHLRQVDGRTARRLQDVAFALMQSREAIIRSVVHQSGHDTRDAVAELEARRLERQRQREKAIAAAFAPGQPSAARLLVQAGLFDRRALRAAASHARSAAAHQDEMTERGVALAGNSPLERRAELIAVLLVPDRR